MSVDSRFVSDLVIGPLMSIVAFRFVSDLVIGPHMYIIASGIDSRSCVGVVLNTGTVFPEGGDNVTV